MNKAIIVTSLIVCSITTQSYSQSTSDTKGNTKVESANGPNDFPELINTNIPGAPKLGKPQLIMGDTIPVRGEGMGWAAPAVYDWNDDGKKDLLIGEFGSGLEKGLGSIGNFVRVYQNKGTDAAPEFYDDFQYAREVYALKESTGTPLSIYTFCCLAFTPRFADLDNDGFTDLLTGQYMPGYITWFRGSEEGFLPGIKLEEAHDPMEARSKIDYSLPITNPKDMDYWEYSSAAFGDFDKDGDQDMVVGGEALRICENIGSKTTPKFGKRALLFDVKGKQLESGNTGSSTVPYAVDWDGDGILDILLTDTYIKEGSIAVTFFRGLKTPINPLNGTKELKFEEGVPLFTSKNGGKAFPGSWLNICVTDWNSDGVNDLIIGASVVVLNGKFDHELSWNWEQDTGIIKKTNAYTPASGKRLIARQMEISEAYQKKLGLNDAEFRKQGGMTQEDLFKHYYGKEAYKTLTHQGYVYVMLGGGTER